MNRNFRQAILIFMFASMSTQLFSSVISSVCPPKIRVSEHLLKLPSGWEVFLTEPNNFLDIISVYSGHPKELASLKPDFTSKEKAKWSFGAAETIYIVCGYNQTSIQLTKRLSGKISSCEVLYDSTVSSEKGFIPKHFRCYEAD